jgi:hypothetical protein
MYEVAGQNVKDTSWTMDKMQILVKKHPDLENDFRQILDDDDAHRGLRESILPPSWLHQMTTDWVATIVKSRHELAGWFSLDFADGPNFSGRAMVVET